MHRFMKNTHLLLGLSCSLFLLMYALSAVQMSHNSWFSLEPVVSEADVAVDASQASDPRALARQLMAGHGLHGELDHVDTAGNAIDIHIERPGTEYDVHYERGSGQAHVKTNAGNLMGVLNRLHHTAGLWHEYTLINLWGVFLGVVSIALFGIGASGVYLWFKIYNERVIGAVLVIAGLVYGLTVVGLIRTA